MAVARWLETDSLTNQSIASATAIGAYTADADRMIVCDVSLDQVAGNGDYVIYVTRQINGAGSAYVMLPKTTCTAAAGETALGMQSGMISVRSGDVLTCYVDGLAGDTTTPDTTVRWFEVATLRPATVDRQLAVAATGEASANVTYSAGVAVSSRLAEAVDLPAAAPTADVVADAVWDEMIADHAVAGSTGEALDGATAPTAAAIWSYVSRTLTATPAQTTDGTTASAITRKRGNSWSISLTLGALTGYTSLWFTVKRSYDDADSAALVQIKLNASGLSDGLLTVNGAAATNDALGSITVSDATTGAIVIALDETVTDDIAPGVYYYDAQALISGDVSTPDSGTLTVTADVTRSVA